MCHYISMNPQKSMEANLQAIRGYLKLNDHEPLPSHNIPSMDLLVWTCRGAGNKRFKRNLRELVQIHKPDIIVLMETKVELTTIRMFFNCMGFTTSTHVDPVGQSGGIWMLWKPTVRDELWDHLEALAQTMKEPWLVAGDFNDFTSANEKRSLYKSNSQSLSQDQRRSQKFNERLNNCKLMDLGCTGPSLTCSNNHQGWANTMVRLDRAMCNTK
ncbi:hypothetical protein ACSBR1_025335 [Camellia fascicularis]